MQWNLQIDGHLIFTVDIQPGDIKWIYSSSEVQLQGNALKFWKISVMHINLSIHLSNNVQNVQMGNHSKYKRQKHPSGGAVAID